MFGTQSLPRFIRRGFALLWQILRILQRLEPLLHAALVGDAQPGLLQAYRPTTRPIYTKTVTDFLVFCDANHLDCHWPWELLVRYAYATHRSRAQFDHLISAVECFMLSSCLSRCMWVLHSEHSTLSVQHIVSWL